MEQEICIFVAVSTIIWVGVVFFRNLIVRNYEIASWRNVFLAGFVHFQAVSVLMEIATGAGASSYVAQPGTYVVYAAMLPLFLGVFLLSSSVGHRFTFAQRLLPKMEYPRTTIMVLTCIAALTVLTLGAVVLRAETFAAGFFTVFRYGFGACAVGLAAYYLLSRTRDPVAWVVFVATFVIAALASTVGGIGRRGLISVLLVGGWIWYYHFLRFKKPSGLVSRLLVVGAVVVVVVATYGTFRGKQEQSTLDTFKSRASQFAGALRGGGLSQNSLLQLAYTDTSIRTLFIIENYPDRYEHIPGNGAGLFFGMPIPRSIWPDKPEGLGLILRTQMDELANLGPGIIGHGWAEGGLIGVVGYALFFGLLTGAIDRVIRERAWNPYFVIAIGAALGDVFGIPRGEASIFLALCVAAFFAIWVPIGLINLVGGSILRTLGSPMPFLGEKQMVAQLEREEAEREAEVWADNEALARDAEARAAAGEEYADVSTSYKY
ncbi:MAG: hypothetical protein KF768_01445 [Phycisphaeraceae bacterium]|nr:hypothetical protein [Phycisphaeraceae bacterium]